METGTPHRSVRFTQRLGLLAAAVLLSCITVIITATNTQSQEQVTMAAAGLNKNASPLSLNCSECRKAGRQILCLDRQRRIASCVNKPPAFGYCIMCDPASGGTPTPAPFYPTSTPPTSATGYPVLTPTPSLLPFYPTPTYAPDPTPIAYCCRVPYTCPNGTVVDTYLTNHGSNADRVRNGGPNVVCQYSGDASVVPGDFRDASCTIPWNPQTACN